MNDSAFVAAVKETTLSWPEFAADLRRQLDLLPSESTRNYTQQRLAKRLTKYLSRAAAFEAQVKIISNIAGDVFLAHKRSADASSSKVLKKAKRTKVAKENEFALPSAQAAASEEGHAKQGKDDENDNYHRHHHHHCRNADGRQRTPNRVEVIVVPAKFVATLRLQYQALLDDFGSRPLVEAVQALESSGEIERTLYAALLEGEKAKCEAKIARVEAESQVLVTKLE
ncbi:hypothetical protein HDU88_007550 [Geranomyces variabilis]|nr:hypothetical protein HDU88_007550 [Geranomyces variabilis]